MGRLPFPSCEPAGGASFAGGVGGIMARIRSDARRVIGTVDRRLFSGFVEHLGVMR